MDIDSSLALKGVWYEASTLDMQELKGVWYEASTLDMQELKGVWNHTQKSFTYSIRVSAAVIKSRERGN